MDANKPLDRTLPQENGFRDACLELGVKEDAEEGCTWDFQSQEMARKRYGPTRLDKVLYCGEIGAGSLEKIGMGVTVEDEVIREMLGERAEWLSSSSQVRRGYFYNQRMKSLYCD